MFVCSSKQKINNFESNVNEDEAKLLMSKLVELAEHAEEICVMSSSRGQVSMGAGIYEQIRLMKIFDVFFCMENKD